MWTGSLGAALMAVFALVGCSGDSGATEAQAEAWDQVFAGPTGRTLLVSVSEGTLDRGSPCWKNFTTQARWTGHAFVVTTLGSQPHPSKAACPALAVPAYAIVHLPRPYAGQPVEDADTGRTHRVLPAIHPSAKEIVNSGR